MESRSLIAFVKKRAVFCAACLCALVSCFFVPPSRAYLAYIDGNTLFMLFALMTAVAGLESCGLFGTLAVRLCAVVHTARSLAFVLVFLCFFTSMLITNDVALLAFVPFALLLFGMQPAIPRRVTALVVVLQTVAANTGSMLTPVGNPQNLFLYNKMGVPLAAFVRVLLPYTVLCGVLLVGALLLVPKTPLAAFAPSPARSPSAGWKKILYAVLFGCCLLAVAGGIPKGALALGVLAAVLAFDRATLLRTDVFLLATFVAFFIFSGNLAAIPAVTAFLQSSVRGHELGAGLAVSQVISNVPATLLLYPFVQDVRALLVGVNIGGLGTLVASLASLISFSLYVKSGRGGGAYLALFTVVNVVALLTLLAFSAILSLWFPA